jgi:outer membrane protein TolC
MNRILFLLIFLLPHHVYSQDLEALEQEIIKDNTALNLNDSAKGMTLLDAIEEGLRKNNAEVLRKYEFQLNELDYKDIYDDFYFPKLSLTMSTSQDHFAENLYRDSLENASSSKTPTGSIGLGFNDYTIFNWGKDYLSFLNSKHSYNRNKEKFKEKKRELRYQIIVSYFNLSRLNKLVFIYKKQLSHTSFIYRLAKEKLSLRKINSQEFLQAKAEFLEAHRAYQDSLFNYYNHQQTFSNLLGDDLKSTYKPIDSLRFKPIAIGSIEAAKMIARNQPSILDAKLAVENSNRDYQRVLKENLPLPKFSLKLGSYQRAYSTSGYEDSYSTFSNSKNIEIAASLNMSWTLYGSGGFFNSRETERSYFQKKISEIKLREAHRESRVANNLTHSRILYLEKKYTANNKQLINARKVFDKTIDNYIASRTKFVDVKQVLEHLRETSIHFENSKYEHLVEKITFASLMGLDDFPGEKFDNLVER